MAEKLTNVKIKAWNINMLPLNNHIFSQESAAKEENCG